MITGLKENGNEAVLLYMNHCYWVYPEEYNSFHTPTYYRVKEIARMSYEYYPVPIKKGTICSSLIKANSFPSFSSLGFEEAFKNALQSFAHQKENLVQYQFKMLDDYSYVFIMQNKAYWAKAIYEENKNGMNSSYPSYHEIFQITRASYTDLIENYSHTPQLNSLKSFIFPKGEEPYYGSDDFYLPIQRFFEN